MSRIRAGLIGTGAITDFHYPAYWENPKVTLHAICDVDADLVRRRSMEWAVATTYSDYRELLANPEIDAVEVITPHHLHVEIGVAALEAGKHGSMQKPMAMNVSECDALIAAEKRSDRQFRVFENFRYYPPMVKAGELLLAGEIGEPLAIRIKCVQGTTGKGWEIPYRRWEWWFDPSRNGGGRVIFDYG